MGEMVSFPSNGTQGEGYLATPESGSGPGVIVIQEWWGLNGHVKDVADRFAKAGFTALAPDLYHGTVAKFLDAIMADGLRPMTRHDVHLSPDVPTAVKVGSAKVFMTPDCSIALI